MLDEFLVGGLLTLIYELACESLYLGSVALRGILFGMNRVTGRDPLPQINFVMGFRLETRLDSGCSF